MPTSRKRGVSLMRNRPKTRAEHAQHWIETFCCYPFGAQRGERVKLSPAQRTAMRKIYDHDHEAIAHGEFAAWLSLLHLAGPEHGIAPPDLAVDVFTTLNSAGIYLRPMLTLRGERVVFRRNLGLALERRA